MKSILVAVVLASAGAAGVAGLSLGVARNPMAGLADAGSDEAQDAAPAGKSARLEFAQLQAGGKDAAPGQAAGGTVKDGIAPAVE